MNFMTKGSAAMSWSGFSQEQDEAEYDVYIFHSPRRTDEEGNEPWEKKRTTVNRLRALAAARRLHESEKYRRVEVMRKVYDRQRRCMAATRFKVYESPGAARKRTAAFLMAVLMLAAVCCAGMVLKMGVV